jgi:hypothetical protein
MKNFEEEWKHIRKTLSEHESVNTLVKKIKNKIIKIDRNEIWLRSDLTGVVRRIPKSQFKEIWDILVSDGVYVTKEHRPYLHSQIIAAIFVISGIVIAEYDPLSIKFK